MRHLRFLRWSRRFARPRDRGLPPVLTFNIEAVSLGEGLRAGFGLTAWSSSTNCFICHG